MGMEEQRVEEGRPSVGANMWELINAGKMEEYAEAKRVALAKGGFTKDGTAVSVAIEKAEAEYWRSQALRELSEKVYRNPDIVSGNVKLGTPELIHVDECVKALQRMMDDTSCAYKGCSSFVHAAHGTSHLEQALGKKGADELLRKMYAAQRLGKAAAKRQKIAKWVLAGVVVLVLVIAYRIFS
ncbi:MAG: hypothetical protein ABSG70_12480 [Terriglobales bacterium]|jgi:hypothetical protein